MSGTHPVQLARLAFVGMVVATAFLLAPSGASAASHLKDLWCTSSTACLAVGASDVEEGEAGSSQVHAKRWNGSAWTIEELDPPDNSVTSVLDGVACASASACTAVGSYSDEEAEATLALAMRWDGTDWEIQEVPKPSGALGAKLADVACTAASACIAVGSYTDAEEVRKSLALSWNGTAWSVLSVPIPSGAGRSELEGISCTASNDCVAVGSFVNSSEVTKTLALSWNGSSWSIASTPEPSGAELNQLYDVSCRPSDACTAVGTYFDSTGDQKTLALRRNTAKEWSIQTTPNKSGALSRTLTAVSCASTTSCTSMGIVEQGRREVPIAIGWNGTSWSEQTIDTESLGAAVVKPESVFCIASNNCDAVGAVSYGRSAAPRNLAFHFNGTAWSVSEAGGYERKWGIRDVSQATSGLRAISCPATERCFAVGSLTEDSGARKGQVASWGGDTWETQAAPMPEEASSVDLLGVSCALISECFAVGSFLDEERTMHPLVLGWNGSAWSVQSVPSPEGATSAELVAVDCPAIGACTAIGTHSEENEKLPMAMTLSDGTWALADVPAPAEASYRQLSAISCATDKACIVVGSQYDAFGHEKSLALRRDGSSWSVVETAELEDNSSNALRGLSCISAFECIAVGDYRDTDGVRQTLAMAWDGTEWEQVEVAGGSALQGVGLVAVSCASSESCVALGGSPSDPTKLPAILRWDGYEWEVEPPEYPPSAAEIVLGGISCVAEEECHAAGVASYGGFAPKNFTVAEDDGVWLATESVDAGGALRGVSCVAQECLAVGDSVLPGGNPATGWTLGEDGWEPADASAADGAFLAEVSCTEPDECTAIGRKGEWPFQPLAERFNGEEWSIQSMPAPSGRSSQLESVSCSSSSWCAVAGFSWPASGAGAAAALIETWNGSAWQIASLSLSGGATSAVLHDVSCSSSSFCVASGTYTDSAAVSHGLIQSWNGSSWNASSVSAPSGYSYRLKGADCASSSACTVVGVSTNLEEGTLAAIATRWDGTSWSTETVPAPNGMSGSRLDDVDCYSSTQCVAVGIARDNERVGPFVVGRSAGTWTEESALAIEGPENISLESISCASAGDCVAVGGSQSPGGGHHLLAIHTEGEPASADPAPTGIKDPPPKLTAAQEETALDLLAEDPAFQAAVGASEYVVSAIGPWTETGEEGEQTIVGAYIAVSLVEPETWEQRTWLKADYELNENHTPMGSYQEENFEAAGTEILALEAMVDTVSDGEGNLVEGEAVDLEPLPFDPLAPEVDGGEIEIDPETLEFDPDLGGY